MTKINLRELSFYKKACFKKGVEKEVLPINQVPKMFYNGHYIEMTVMNMLGALHRYLYKERGINCYVECSAKLDSYGYDFKFNNKGIQLKSKFRNQYFITLDACFVEVDSTGWENLITIMEYVGYNTSSIFFDEEFKEEIERIWLHYVKGLELDER